MTTIEKLNAKYFEHTGTSPEYNFWSWLEAMGVEPNERELKALLCDDKMWLELSAKGK